MLIALTEAGYQTVGIDLSQQMGALSRSRLRRAGAEALLLRGMAQNLPFRSRLFDSVLVTFPTDFLVANETLAAVNHALKPDGRFVIVLEAHFTTLSLPERIIEWLYFITGQRYQDHNVQIKSTGLPHESRWDSLKQQFRAAGFLLDIHTTTLERSHVTVLFGQKINLQNQKY
jgi:ubiquinone/menaquinone biosynthesis C-methylase UbiE